MAESQWHLEVNGKKVGPFTLDQIQGLYDDGEIRGYHQVTSDQLDGKWISVQELVDSAAIAAPAPPPDYTGETPQLKPPVSEFILEDPVLEAPELEAPVLEAVTLEAPVLEAVGEAETFEATQAISLPELVEAGEQVSSEPALYQEKGAAPKAFSNTTQTSPNIFQNSFKEPRQDFNADFQPPPRPADLNTSTSAHTSVPPSAQDAQPVTTAGDLPSALPSLESSAGMAEPVVATTAYTPANQDSNDRVAADPALSLLSSLQNLRERQTSQIQHDPTIILHSDSISGSLRKPVPMRMWVTAIFAGIILGALSIGLIKVFKHKPVMGVPGSLTEINQSKPPIQAQTPPGLGQTQTPIIPPPPHMANGGKPQNFAHHGEIRAPKPAPLPPQGATAVPANSSIREREPLPPQEQNNQGEQNQNGNPPGQPQQNPLQPPMDLSNPPPPGYPPGYPQQPQQPGQPMQQPQQPGQPMDPNLNNGNGYPPPPPAPGYPQNPGNPAGDPNQGGYPPPQGNGEQPQGQGYPPQGNGEQVQPQPGGQPGQPGQDQFQQQPPAQPNIQQ